MENQKTIKYGRPLSELSLVDWVSLEYAYGNAEDIPAQLQAISVCNDEDFAEIFSRIWNGYNIYSATPHMIPFLIGILETNERGEDILFLLGLIGRSKGAEYKDVLGELEAGLPVFLPYLRGEDEQEASAAAYLLGSLFISSDEALNALRKIAYIHPSFKVKATAIYHLRFLALPPEFKTHLLKNLSGPSMLALASALALSHNLGRDAPPEVFNILSESVKHRYFEDFQEDFIIAPDDVFWEIVKSCKSLGKIGEFGELIEICSKEEDYDHLLDYFDKFQEEEV